VYFEVIDEVDRRMAAQDLFFTTAHEFYRHRWAEILQRCSLDAENAAELADHYARERRENYCFYPEALPLIAELREEYRLALVTNGPSDLQREKMAAIEIERWIPEVYVSGELGVWKPQRAIFHHVLAALGCDPGEAVMVGDSATNDIAGAAGAGLRSVWVNRYGGELPPGVRPDAVVTDLRPLPGMLSAWNDSTPGVE